MPKKSLLIIVLFLLSSAVFYVPLSAQDQTTVALPEGLQPITVANGAKVTEVKVFDPDDLNLPKFTLEGEHAGNAEWMRAILTAAVAAGLGGSAISSDYSMSAVALVEEVLFIADVKNARAIARAQWLGGEFEDAVSTAISPDKATLAVGDENGMVTLLDTKKKTETASWQAQDQDQYVYVAFNPDGSLLATGGDVIHLWNPATGEEVAQFANPEEAYSLDFSADGSLLAVGGLESVTLWDVAGGEKLVTLDSHTDYVPSVAFSPDGSLLASGSSDGTVYLWDVASKELLATLTGEVSETDYLRTVVFVDFSPDGALLLSSSQDGMIHLWGTTD